MVATSNLPPGHRIADKYRIVSRLGRGSAGTVYRAVQENVDREVALKLLSATLAERPAMVERFRREAHHISQLTHPNTVTLFDYGATEDGLYYIVMELLEGQTLRSVLRRQGALSPPRATRILSQVLRSLAEAHDKGIVHRDLKPDNIFLAEIPGEVDFVKVLDFGIAKAIDRDEVQLTEHGTVFGTPSYMAPEQATGQGVSPATDVYAVALLFYEMLSGQMAFRADSMYALLNMQVFEPVPGLTGELAEAPYNALIASASAKEPKERPENAGAFLKSLQAALRLDVEAWQAPVMVPQRSTEPLKSLDALLKADAQARQADRARLLSPDGAPPSSGPAKPVRHASAKSAVDAGDAPEPREVPRTVILEAPLGGRAERPPVAGRGASVRPGEADVETALGLSPVPSDAASVASDATSAAERTFLDVVRASAAQRPELSLDIESPFEAPTPLPPMATDILVGRGEALKALEESLKPLAQGDGGGLGVIVGPSGVGRTHLLEAFLAEKSEGADLTAVMVQVPEATGGERLSAVFSALRQLRSQALDPDGLLSQQMDRWLHAEMGHGHPLFSFFARLMDDHAPVFDASRVPDELFGGVLEALAHLMLTLATAQPLLVIFDDAHHLDEWTLHWLTMLADAQGLTRAPLAVWTSLRVGSSETPSDAVLERLRWSVGGPRVVLKPLTRDDHEAFVKLLAPASAELCDQLWALTSGHPGQTLACFEEAVEARTAQWRSGRWWPVQRLRIPTGVVEEGDDAGERSTDRWLIFQWASVLGAEIPRAALQRALRQDPRVRQLGSMSRLVDALISQGALHQEGESQRLTIRDSLKAASHRRRFERGEGLHQQHEIAYEIKKTLSWSDPSERDFQLGEHLMMSGAPERAVKHLLSAADAARRAGDLASSRRAYALSRSLMEQLGWGPTHSMRVSVEVAQAEIGLHLGMLSDVEQALTVLEADLKALPERRTQQSQVGLLLGLVHAARGELEVAARRGQVLLNDAPTGSATVSHVEVIWSLGRIAYALGARPLFAQAQARLKLLSQTPSRAVQGRSFLGLGILSWLDGDASGARGHLEACLEVHQEARGAWPVAMARLCLGHQALEHGRFEEADLELSVAAQHADRIGAQPLMCEIWCAQARLGLERRDESLVEGVLCQAWAMAGELALPSAFVDVSLTTAWWRAARSEVRQAQARLREGERLLEALGQRQRPDPRWSFTIARVLESLSV